MDDVKIPNFRLDGKVAVVTGGTSGIGYAIALTFANYGADVVVAALPPDECARVEGEIASLGVRSLGVAMDVTDPVQVDALIRTTVEKMGKVDITVCAAGIVCNKKAFDLTPEDFQRVFDIDAKGVFLCATAAAKQMVEQGTGGRIIAVASAAAFSGSPTLAAYCTAKAGVVNLVKALATEWARYQITVNALCPGYVATPLNKETFANERALDAIIKHSPLRRLGTVEEMAAAALYLASDFSGDTTGTSLLVDGGGAAM